MDEQKKQEEIRRQIDAFGVLGDAPAPGKVVDNPRTQCFCGTLIDVASNSRKVFSGTPGSLNGYGVEYIETLCPTCRTDAMLNEQCRGVCVKCKAIKVLIRPGKMSTGFEFIRGRHYHLTECPHCTPDCKASEVLEHAVFCKENKVVTKKDLDLVQDIEQKTLQMENNRERLRQDINKSWTKK